MQEQPKVNVVVKRIIDAPVELVWQAWTSPDHVTKWWGPAGFSSPSAKIDLREGGKYIFAMQAAPEMGGQLSYTAGTYKKIVPNELLEFTQGLSTEDGTPLDPAHLPEGFPVETRTVVEFKKFKTDMTKLVVTEYGWVPGQMFVFALAGMNQSVDKLTDTFGE